MTIDYRMEWPRLHGTVVSLDGQYLASSDCQVATSEQAGLSRAAGELRELHIRPKGRGTAVNEIRMRS